MCFVAPGRAVSHTVAVGSPRGARRLAILDRLVGEMVSMWARSYRPHTIWLEQPVGGRSRPNPHLVAAWGVIQARCYSHFQHLDLAPTEVFSLTPTAWKKQIGLKGNADKATVAQWCVFEGFKASTQDELDAYAIARAGARIAPIGPAESAP